MNNLKLFFVFIVFVVSCKPKAPEIENENKVKPKEHFTIAFGSCNNQNLPNTFWNEISKNNPDVWIWGGDVIYTDTEDVEYMKQNYQKQKLNEDYKNFISDVDVLATWDDHDFGKNDGGSDYIMKKEAQKLFLDFFEVPENDERRNHDGVYYSKEYAVGNHTIRIIVLDTRYFRSELTPSSTPNKRYQPNNYGEGTLLGATQWEWLKNQLTDCKATFNIIISSIQFLSHEHGFECWGNMPHEVDKFEALLKETGANNVIILSGDRHISEISKKNIEGIPYPLIDFTSSGLTHSYTNYSGETNEYRVGEVISKKSFGLLKFDFNTQTVLMEMKGEHNSTYQAISQNYFW